MVDITLKDQYKYLISTAELLNEEEKHSLIAQLEMGMTPELQEKLIQIFQAESDSIDESIQNLAEARDAYTHEQMEAEEAAAPVIEEIDRETDEVMAHIEKEAAQEMDQAENDHAKAMEGDAREEDSAQADAIRAQLGVQGK